MAMQVKFFLKPCALQDVTIDIPNPAQFNLNSFMQSVKAVGYFCNEVSFVPYDYIASVMYGDEKRFQLVNAKTGEEIKQTPVLVPPPKEGTVSPFPPRPEPEGAA